MDGFTYLVPLCGFIGLSSSFQSGSLLGGLGFCLVAMRIQQRSGMLNNFHGVQLISPFLLTQNRNRGADFSHC